MVALKQWVRDIMLILLLAHALELAVPFGASRRYVRLGAGLVLLLALLQPMLTLLRADFDAVLLQAVDRSAIDTAVERRVGLVQDAQAIAASEIGQRLSADAVAAIAAEYGMTLERIDVDRFGTVVISLGGAADGAGSSTDAAGAGSVPALGAIAQGRFISEVANALGIGMQRVDVRWPHEGEGSR